MGLEWVCVLLQGCNEAKPSVTPAYALTAPNGALPDISSFKSRVAQGSFMALKSLRVTPPFSSSVTVAMRVGMSS